jgi:hypothetical protein
VSILLVRESIFAVQVDHGEGGAYGDVGVAEVGGRESRWPRKVTRRRLERSCGRGRTTTRGRGHRLSDGARYRRSFVEPFVVRNRV